MSVEAVNGVLKGNGLILLELKFTEVSWKRTKENLSGCGSSLKTDLEHE